MDLKRGLKILREPLKDLLKSTSHTIARFKILEETSTKNGF